MQKYVCPIIDLDSIAYLNLFKWRSRIFEWRSSQGLPAHAYYQSWQEHTGKQYRLLRPNFVIALGSSTTSKRFRAVSSARDTADVKIFSLKRARNDQLPPPEETLRLMPEIAEEIRQHSSS